MHGVDEGVLGLEASQIMASLRSNGWTVTGKLGRDQPDIFAPGVRLFHLQEAIVKTMKEAIARVPAK